MTANDVSHATRTLPATMLTDTEAQLDMKRLRAYRLGRLRQQLIEHDYGACVLFDPISIRYATGYRNHPLFQLHIPSYCLFVPAEGPVVLLLEGAAPAGTRGLETIGECRSAPPFSHFTGGRRRDEWVRCWAKEIADLMRDRAGQNRRLAVGPTDVRATLALSNEKLALFDALEPVERARAIKSIDEVLCMNASLAVAETGLALMREALRPGISEMEWWAILHHTNISRGGDWIDARIAAAGDHANPWLREAGARLIRPGELIGVDTDMVGPFGYCADLSRTFHCGPGKPTQDQRDLYKLALEEIHHNMGLVKAGLSFREFTEKAWKQPEQYVANRYPVLAHGIGLCDEWPSIFYPSDWNRCGYDGIVEENMMLCIESYIGVEGGHEGVKLEEVVLVTARGYELLTRFPFEDELLV
jgi:Xaa-Pro aminopeptidase